MSDSSSTIVDIEISKRAANAAADRVIEYLVERRIIRAKPTPCVLSEAKGYAPATRYAEACDRPRPSLLKTTANGLEVCIGRSVFVGFENPLVVRCPGCKYQTEDADDAWMVAVGQWHEGDDSVTYACPKCNKPRRLVLWDGSFPWGFGNLGFTFWNWPDLKQGFIKEVAGILGHEVRVVRARL